MKSEQHPAPIGLVQLVREHILPYNTLFALSGFVAVVLGIISPYLVVGLGIALIASCCVLFGLDVTMRQRMAAWAHSEDITRARRIGKLLWHSPDSSLRSAGLVWAALIVGAAVAIFGIKGVYEQQRTERVPPRQAAARPTAGPLSILVLPFANQTGDVQKAYVADALTATVTTDLARLTDAYVIPTTTALTFRDRNLTVQQVGAEAGVRFVLQGSVLSTGQSVRLTAQLADTLSGAVVWNDTVDGDVTDLFALQDKVTTGIGKRIQREMVVRAARDSETRKSTPAAADLVLRARALSLKPRSMENFAQIEALLRQALTLEPDDQALMAGLAGTLATSANNFGGAMGKELSEKKYADARELALKGIAVDPDRSANHATLSMYAFAHDDYLSAVQSAERNLALNAKSPQAHNLLASILVTGDDPRQALEICNKAVALDPLHVSELIWVNQGRAYMRLGEYDKAIEALNKSLVRNPSLVFTRTNLVLAHALKGDDVQARALAADLLRDNPGVKVAALRGRMGRTTPQSYKDFVETQLVPAWLKAGLPP